jgi:hypothetical protein
VRPWGLIPQACTAQHCTEWDLRKQPTRKFPGLVRYRPPIACEPPPQRRARTIAHRDPTAHSRRETAQSQRASGSFARARCDIARPRCYFISRVTGLSHPITIALPCMLPAISALTCQLRVLTTTKIRALFVSWREGNDHRGRGSLSVPPMCMAGQHREKSVLSELNETRCIHDSFLR